MGGKIKGLYFFVVILVIICTAVSLFFVWQEKNEEGNEERENRERGNMEQESRGLFSWKSAALEDGGEEMLAFMKQYGFTEVYQWFSSNLERDVITTFLRNAQREGIGVYMLTGDPSWAKDPHGEKLLQRVENAVQINRACAGAGLIKGMVFDVEPYLLEEWKTDADSLMKGFVEAMGKVYQETSRQNLETVLCVPYYYDSKGFENELDTLIRTGCDKVAVMNYYKKKEAEQIAAEVACAQKYGKGLINIYEFQAPGKHSVTEINTYYKEGLRAAQKNFGKLEDVYPDAYMMMAAHDYEALKEGVASREYRPEAGEEVPD